MQKSTCVPGTGTNVIPRLFCQGCSLVAFSRAVGTCSWADGLAIRIRRRALRTYKKAREDCNQENKRLCSGVNGPRALLGAKRKYVCLHWFRLLGLGIEITIQYSLTY